MRATPAHAQTAAQNAASITVRTSETGTPIIGHLLEIGPATLTLLVDGSTTNIPVADVLRIDAPGDPVRNGAIIGATILGVWCAIICGQGLDDPGNVALAAVANAGLGAVIGAGIDAMHTGTRPIYRRSAQPAVRLAVGLRLPGWSH